MAKKTRKPIKKRKPAVPKQQIVLWLVGEQVGEKDWYMVFSKSRAEALRLVVSLHYNMPVSEYVRDYMPLVRRVKDDEPIVVNIQGKGQFTRTAKDWCRENKFGVGPFISTTYEV